MPIIVTIILTLILTHSMAGFSQAQESKKPITKQERKMAAKTLKSFEKAYKKTSRIKTAKTAIKEVQKEMFCAGEIIEKINKSKKITDDDKFFYILAFIILYRADAVSTMAKSVESDLLRVGSWLKKRSAFLEKKGKGKREKRIARGLLGQALMAEDYLRMPEANFCQEYQILEEEGYDSDTAYSAYINLVSWEISEWAVSPEFEYAINMIYASYNPMFNARPSFSMKRLYRFEEMHTRALLPWVRKKEKKNQPFLTKQGKMKKPLHLSREILRKRNNE